MKAIWQKKKQEKTKSADDIQKLEAQQIKTDAQEGALNESSTLGQLGAAIRRSSLFFVLATIALIIASILLINRQNALSNIVKLHNDTDAFEVSVLQMRQNEKDFQLTQQQTHVLKHDKQHEQALEALKNISSSTMLLPEDNIRVSRLNNALSTYKRIFDDIALVSEKDGLDDTENKQQRLSEQAKVLNAKAPKGGILEASLQRLNNIARKFSKTEDSQYMASFIAESQRFKEAVANSELNVETKSELTQGAEKYLDILSVSSKKDKQDVDGLFEDATVAAHASLYTLPKFKEKLIEREKTIFKQVLWILIATTLVLIGIFLLVLYQLRNAQKGANLTLEETIAAQKKAEDENEQLNNSVISILQSVNQLSQRDLTARAPVTEDVIGTVSDSINYLTDETSKVLKDVTNVAGQVKDSSEKVQTQAILVTKTAEKERQSVQNMVESLLSATQSMNQVASLAEESNKAGNLASEVTENALHTVNNTVSGMESIRETIAETEKRIKRLGERSQEISGIVNLINTISERTHVLALNASMQAAVAGEAGRGFAVVAEEVQRLAESSRNATQQIASLVNNIQVETNETINTVNDTISQVVDGSAQAQKAGEQMRQTQEITNKLVEQVRAIANASDRQKDMSAELLKSVQEIGNSTQQTATQIQAQNEETNSLQEAAQRLVESVGVFKLP